MHTSAPRIGSARELGTQLAPMDSDSGFRANPQDVISDGDTIRDLIDAPFSARSGVHEYGGGAAWVESRLAWFVNWDDQRIYRAPLDGSHEPTPITPAPTTAMV